MPGSRKRGFGSVRRLPSGRVQARYTAPDGRTLTAPTTFDTRQDAEAWLAVRHSEIVRGAWLPPDRPGAAVTFGEYAATWLADRDLKPRTRALYARLLDGQILPTFRATAITAITAAGVRTWHAAMVKDGKPTRRAHAYSLLRTVLATAVADEMIPTNPCHIRGAGQAKRQGRTDPATLDELAALAAAMPAKYRAMVLLAAWCALRFGELTELRRSDLDLARSRLHVRRGVVRLDGDFIVGTPKSDAGIRVVAVPPHLIGLLRAHVLEHAEPGRNGLLFPAVRGGHMSSSSLYKVFKPARAEVGRPDLTFHDLRHTGAVLAAATGATLAELMARLGHSTPAAAMLYQHASADRDQVIAAALSDLDAAHQAAGQPADRSRSSRSHSR